ncbi:hypothetical protein RvY_09609 [Ramazzottius varieornatus]|uniref:Multifunctional fusion protein n=1 Tax=Ramazzottius varieornatus TaxID=947166 RepID=A0A1D1V9Y7_RAMVA|nr:hypothetical protein RvY_09609 [Ramazzottius varieornatus]
MMLAAKRAAKRLVDAQKQTAWRLGMSNRLVRRQIGLMQALEEVKEAIAPEAPKVNADLTHFKAENEPMFEYLKDSPERKRVQASLARLQSQMTEVPIVVGDQEKRTRDFRFQVKPFEHRNKLAKFYHASADIIQDAIAVSIEAQKEWEVTPLEERAKIFLRAADLVSNKYRADLLAATMLGQGKTVWQAEIDAAAELADFLRMNVQFALEMTRYQPISTTSAKNSMVYRGLEGFVAAVPPFNFTAIGGNLSAAPALMGNVVLWKPSDTAVLSNYIVFKIFQEAGLPPGVINFLPADGPTFGSAVTRSPHLGGINFTGSVSTFQWLWKKVADNLNTYKNFPRIVGEAGGKNFHLIHSSADIPHAVNNTIRSAFEYSGQKCSACSRAYVPDDIWPEFRKQLLEQHSKIKLGSPVEFDTFMSAVIDERSFERVKSYIEHAHNSKELKVIAGGKTDKSKGYFIEPTIVDVTTHAKDKIMKEEIFGPVLSIYVYPANDMEGVVKLVQTTTPFSLTGAIFAKDESVLEMWRRKLRFAAGNLYINDKSTGAVVGQQPFGGARHSGTNDKAGGPHYLLRWTSEQSVKRGLVPLADWKYKHMVA